VGGIYGSVVRVQPPLVITRQQINRAVDAIAQAIEQVQAKHAATVAR